MTEKANFEGADSAVNALVEVVNSASRNLTLYSPELDYMVFGDTRLVSALSTFARSSAIAKVSILISDSKAIVSRGHKLVDLVRRLPSHFSIRKRAVGNKEPTSFAFADRRAYWFLPDSQLHDGYYHLDDPVRVEHLAEQFAELSRRSKPDPELSVLQL